MTYDLFQEHVVGFHKWPNGWYRFYLGDPGPASSLMLECRTYTINKQG